MCDALLLVCPTTLPWFMGNAKVLPGSSRLTQLPGTVGSGDISVTGPGSGLDIAPLNCRKVSCDRDQLVWAVIEDVYIRFEEHPTGACGGLFWVTQSEPDHPCTLSAVCARVVSVAVSQTPWVPPTSTTHDPTIPHRGTNMQPTCPPPYHGPYNMHARHRHDRDHHDGRGKREGMNMAREEREKRACWRVFPTQMTRQEEGEEERAKLEDKLAEGFPAGGRFVVAAAAAAAAAG
ncbi:hypothetical protein EDB83DRAFT_2325383 [Lactarius deliciosus]|nr:hypothetical protein EDB83DRAFT_2325383 [Lactarius deliciosus]